MHDFLPDKINTEYKKYKKKQIPFLRNNLCRNLLSYK